jgi:phosphoribosylformylglycinamidine synthase
LGGSHYYKNKGHLGNTVPKVRIDQAKKTIDLIIEAIDRGYLRSCHDLSEGGLAVASAEMAFSGGHGIELDLQKVPRTRELNRNDFILFSESNSRFLVEVTEKNRTHFEALMKEAICNKIGKVKKDNILSVKGVDGEQKIHADLEELRNQWKSTLGA